ncbi:HAD family hydrolase [Ructibacterium gallinarum]|uniref:HAD family phosphatase n=1 Tax=Ructibacterium gallinarum TaxID=2779355 RepID=A0A9D5R940_9FIRM|nr:HAD family phosphatase [Ructibacterium gallinarum]MBE5040660.1 HAD family phosphatase [Ructibacterium gallinarum]
MKKIEAVIFDMDGVLVDSEPVIMRAATEALAEEGIPAGYETFRPYIGAGEEHFILDPGRQAGKEEKIHAMMARMYELYAKYAKIDLKVYPSAVQVITQLRQRGLHLALVSSSQRQKLLVSLEAAGIDAKQFDLILSGSEVTKKKPDPEPYRLAGERLGVLPKCCLVIEDALSGIAAAKGAGMQCAAVTTSFSASELMAAGADAVMEDIMEILDILNEKE